MLERLCEFPQEQATGSECLIREAGQEYFETLLPAQVRPRARDRIDWHKNNGDRIVVVSASLDVYLKPWCRAHGLELICSKLEVADGICTGRHQGNDCSGSEKAERISRKYNLDDYESVFAYGDTSEDNAMLGLADKKFYRWLEV